MTSGRPRGISRLNYSTTVPGWNVRYTREGVTFSQLFSDSKYGSSDAALDVAIAWRKEAESVLGQMDRLARTRRSDAGTIRAATLVSTEPLATSMASRCITGLPRGVPSPANVCIDPSQRKSMGKTAQRTRAVAARKEAIANLDPNWPEGSWESNRTKELEREFHRDVFGFEGDEAFAIHRHKERDRELRQTKIDAFLEEHGDLFCEICRFSFERQYGVLGRGLIEIHHLLPMAEMVAGHKTTLDELMCVCSNCHLVLHTGDPTKNLETLRFVFESQATKRKRTKRCTRGGDRVKTSG